FNIGKATPAEQQVRAKSFVLASSTCESTRLLLNSRSTQFPQGLANSSGVVGRYLVDSVGSDGIGYFPQLEKMPPHNHDGVGGMHFYVPWWKYDRKNDFVRGYHLEFGGGREMPGVGEFHEVCHQFEGYGGSLQRKCREMYGAFIGMAGRGEMIRTGNNYCQKDQNRLDG